MERMGAGRKLIYGMGGLTMSLPDLVFMQWIFIRYVPGDETALAPARLFGVLVFSARVIGAVAEPIIGHWSDNCHTRFGRRLPFIRSGMIPMALCFFLMWMPPVGHLHWVNAVYALVLMLAYLLCFPTVITPYLALLPEITTDLWDRVALATVQAAFVMLGTILFASMGLLLNAGGWPAMAGFVAAIILIGIGPVAWTTREQTHAAVAAHDRSRLLPAILSTLKNRAFRRLVGGTAMVFFGFNCVLAALPYWVTIYLERDKDTVTLLMAPFLAVTMVLFAAVGPLVARFGKYRVFLGSILGISLCLALFSCAGLAPWGDPLTQMIVLVTLLGVPMTGFIALPFALLADVIDYDEKRTGRRREALFFAVQGTIQKTLFGCAGLTFSMVAYTGPANTVSIAGLRGVTLIAAAAGLLGFFIFSKYPLREVGGVMVFPEESRENSP